VYFPRGEGAQLVRFLHVIEKRQHLAELVYSVLRHAFSVVFRVEPFQALMDDVPYFHAKPSVACNLTLVKAGAPSIQAIEFVVEQDEEAERMTTSPLLTGGAGFDFEDSVAVVYLTAPAAEWRVGIGRMKPTLCFRRSEPKR
jgi:hypothetical protein